MSLCPYISLPAKGPDFYGRKSYLHAIRRGPKTNHLLGMRGSGKTSILLKVCEAEVGLYFTFQPMVGEAGKFRSQTYLQLLEKRADYPWLPQMGRRDDPFAAIAEAAILARQAGCTLFLLFDEAEGLQRFEADFLQQIGELLSGIVPARIALASAKNIGALNEHVIELGNSPLLLPRPLYLAGLEDEAATALICQSASDAPLNVPPPIIEAIKEHTNNQPHLIQWLCSRLWSRDEAPDRWQITEDLLHLYDDQLADRFRADFNYLSPQERLIVRAILHNQPLPDDIPAARLARFLKRLTDLGYLRRLRNNTYKIGNSFLLNWFRDSEKKLNWEEASVQQPSDQAADKFYSQTTQDYNLRRLRKFLTKCFSDPELRHFCFDTPAFRPVYEQLSSQMGKEQVIQHLLEFAERRLLLNKLLAGLRQINPPQYQAYYGPTETPEMMAFPKQKQIKEHPMTDPYSLTWALMVMEKATEFLFTQAGETLKEWREKRKKDEETPASLSSETEAESPINDSKILMTTLEEQLGQLEKQAGEASYRMQVQKVESLMKQLENYNRNKLMYEEEAAKLLNLDDRVATRRRIEDIDNHIAQKAGEMRQTLEQLSQRKIHIPALDE